MGKWRLQSAAALLPLLLCAGCASSAGTLDAPSQETASGIMELQSGVFSDRDRDGSWDEDSAVKIRFSGSGADIQGEGASLEGDVLRITRGGTYLLSGDFAGMLSVEAGEDKVQLVLAGVDIANGDGPALWVQEADKVFLTLPEDSENRLADGASYTREGLADNVDAAVFSKADLTLNGSGKLEVAASCKHGIVTKDSFAATGGEITVSAPGQAINGKDSVKIGGGVFRLESGGDGIQSDNSEDAEKGYVYIEDGSFSIVSGGDGIQAGTALEISGGEFSIAAGGGSGEASQAGVSEDAPSTKGLKAGTSVVLSGGSFEVDALDDAVHSNGDVTVSGGTLALQSGDDGIHADGSLAVTGGELAVSRSYEGLEGQNVDISGGVIDITASDDGVNAAGGNDGSAAGGWRGGDPFAADEDAFIRIAGGSLTVNASGDGLDSNGALIVEGGEVYINGPTGNGDGALDSAIQPVINGGTLVAVGSAGMAQGFSEESAQCSFCWNLSSGAEGELVLTDEAGEVIFSFTPEKAYQSVTLSLPELALNGVYTLQAGGQTEEITLSSQAVSNGRGGFGGGFGGHGGKRGRFPEGQTPPDGQLPPEPPSGSFPEGETPPEGGHGGRGDVSGPESSAP